jgi:uncharacterized membrane protein
MKRVDIVDSLRGLAIVLMLFQHSFKYLIEYPEESIIYVWAILLSRLSFPIFLMVSGYCIGLSAEKRERFAFFRRIIWRFLFLIIAGSFVSVLRFGSPTDINVLHIIGFSALIAGMFHLNNRIEPLMGLTLVLFLYSATNPHHHSDVLSESPFHIMLLASTTGEYPPLPWIIYSLLGLIIYQTRDNLKKTGINPTIVGELLILAGLLSAAAGLEVNMTYNSAPFMLLVLGFSAITYDLTKWITEKSPFSKDFLSTLGRHSLKIYVIHQFLFITLPRIINMENTLKEHIGFMIFLGFLAATYMTIKKKECLTNMG